MRIVCSKCGAKAKPGCQCGVAYVPAHVFAAKAVAAHPEKSDRTIAKEIGVSDKTVAKARKATAEKSAVAKRIGRDGKARKLPNKRMTPEAANAMRARAEAVARLFPPPFKTIPKRPALSLSRRCGCSPRAATRRRYSSSASALASISIGPICWCRQMKTKARFASRPLNGQSASLPPHDHPAILDGRTIYPGTVVSPRDVGR